MTDLNTAKFVVWGFRTGDNSFRYIHEAFYRALVHMGKDVKWLEKGDDIAGIDFSDTFFISMNYCVDGMPRRPDCFYAIHNVEALTKEYLAGLHYMNYGLFVSNMPIPVNAIKLARDTFFFPQGWDDYDSVVFRWGTNLLPHEIEANKPAEVFRSDSKVINYIGCSEAEWGEVLKPFGQAAFENGILFRPLTGISHDDHVRLIRESYMAPAVNIKYQSDVGYIPCRYFKNISYGQYPVTNNDHAFEFFKKGVFCADGRELFYKAKDFLPKADIGILHALMDEVALNHTYLNKIDALLKAAKMSQESR